MTRVALLALPLLVGCSLDLSALSPGTDGGPVPEPTDAGVADTEITSGWDAGGEIIEPIQPDDAGCGLPGLACCEDAVACELGSCLRGRCTSYSGVVAYAPSCADPCAARNPYTAGCGCALGFVRSDGFGELATECPDGSASTVDLGFCDAGENSLLAEWGGAHLSVAAAPECGGGCPSPHGTTGECACPAGTEPFALRVGRHGPCGIAAATLTLCTPPAPEGAFAGAYQLDPLAPTGCSSPNPVTGGCTCPEGTTAQRLALRRPTTAGMVTSPITFCVR